MKKLSLTFLVLALCSCSFAQNSFPTSNAIWYIENRYHGFGFGSSRSFLYGLIGETSFTINDTAYTYSKLCLISDTILSEESIKGYIGGFRNEGQKVFFNFLEQYYLDEDSLEYSPDILLFDFGAEVGDTVWHNGVVACQENGLYRFLGYDDYKYTIIYAIDTINGIKRVNYDWLEGIGGKAGFFEHIVVPTVGPGYLPDKLECFKYNGIVVYPNYIYPEKWCHTCPCSGVVGVENFENFDNNIGINIFPNPTKDVLNVDIPKDVNVKSIAIYSIDGSLIEKNRYPLLSGQLNIGKLKNGTYIIHIETEKGCFSKKVTKN